MVKRQDLVVNQHVNGLSQKDRNIIIGNYYQTNGQRKREPDCLVNEPLFHTGHPPTYENAGDFQNAVYSMKWLGRYLDSLNQNKKAGELLPWSAINDITITPTSTPPCDHQRVHKTSQKCWKCRTDKIFATEATNEVHPGMTWA